MSAQLRVLNRYCLGSQASQIDRARTDSLADPPMESDRPGVSCGVFVLVVVLSLLCVISDALVEDHGPDHSTLSGSASGRVGEDALSDSVPFGHLVQPMFPTE